MVWCPRPGPDVADVRPAGDSPIPFAAPDIDDADIAAVERVLRSGWLTTGDESAALEQELSTRCGVAHAVSMASGTAALETCFAHLDLRPGARVAVPTWTFVSSALAPAHHGALPVLLDVDPGTLNVSPVALERALDSGLDAVVAVHFGGVPVDPVVYELCAAARVPVVEDAAHALGAIDHRGPIGGRGTVGACFSFYATKNVTSAEGGALTTEDPDLAEFARSYRLHGLSKDSWARYRPGGRATYDLLAPGIKANLPDVLAALVRSQLHRLDAMQARRRELVTLYRTRLSAYPGLTLVPESAVDGSADHLMVVVLPEHVVRDEVITSLENAGIGTSVHFQPLHRFRWFTEQAELGPGGCPAADTVADRALSLPLHSSLSPAAVERVCDELASALA